MRRPRYRGTAGLITLSSIVTIAGAIFLYAIGEDALLEIVDFRFFFDSDSYIKFYNGDPKISATTVAVNANYLGPLVIMYLTLGNPYLVLIVNVLIFVLSVRYIAAHFDLNATTLTCWMLLSPLTTISLLSVNKEILALPFIAFAIAGFRYRSVRSLIIAGVISILCRWQLTLFYFVALATVPVSKFIKSRMLILIALLVVMSGTYLAAFEFLGPVINRALASFEDYTGKGSGIFVWVISMQNSGLYFLIFPLKALHYLFGLGLRLDRLFWEKDPSGIGVIIHCQVSLIVFVLLVIRRKLSLNSDLIFASALYTAIFCISPIFSPRYLYPVYITWVLVLCGAPQRITLRSSAYSRADATFQQRQLHGRPDATT
jgi:hypothetical protein